MSSKWALALAVRAIVKFNRVVQRLESSRFSFSRLFHSGEFEFERDKLVQLWMALSKSKFDRLLEEEFIIESRTNILTGKRKYKINVEKLNTFSNKVKSEDLATHAVIDDEMTAEVDISKARHVSIVKKTMDQTCLFKKLEGMTELRALLLIRDYGSSLNQIPPTFFKSHNFMEALDLSGSHIKELPSSVGEMKHLRFLDLSYTLIQRIPESICHLGKLQTFKLKECKDLHSLPNGMGQLTGLCHLDFNILGQLTCMPKGMGTLTALCTLSAFIVSRQDGYTLRELKDLNNLAGSFCISGLEYATSNDAREANMKSKKYLTRLNLKWNEAISYDSVARLEAEYTLENLRMETPLKELQISYYPGSKLPGWILRGYLLGQLVSVTFYRWHIESLFALDRIPNLKDINFIDMDRVKTIDSNAPRSSIKERYPKLETFTIDGMLKMENWTGIEKNDCPRLSKLIVKHCPQLTQLDFLPHLRSLKYLEISHCKALEFPPEGRLPDSLETLVINQCSLSKTTCSQEGEDWKKIEHVPYIWIDMKGIGYANEEPDSDEDSDYSDEDSNRDDETLIKNSDEDSDY